MRGAFGKGLVRRPCRQRFTRERIGRTAPKRPLQVAPRQISHNRAWQRTERGPGVRTLCKACALLGVCVPFQAGNMGHVVVVMVGHKREVMRQTHLNVEARMQRDASECFVGK